MMVNTELIRAAHASGRNLDESPHSSHKDLEVRNAAAVSPEGGGGATLEKKVVRLPDAGRGSARNAATILRAGSARKLQFGSDLPRAELEHRVARLSKIKLFAALDLPEIESAARAMEKGDFERDDAIICQGEEGDACYIVDSGTADVFVDDVKVHHYEAGGFFGEWALLRHELRAGSVVASGHLSVYRLDKEDFAAIIEERDHLEDLIRSLEFFERMSDDKVAHGAHRARRLRSLSLQFEWSARACQKTPSTRRDCRGEMMMSHPTGGTSGA